MEWCIPFRSHRQGLDWSVARVFVPTVGWGSPHGSPFQGVTPTLAIGTWGEPPQAVSSNLLSGFPKCGFRVFPASPWLPREVGKCNGGI